VSFHGPAPPVQRDDGGARKPAGVDEVG